MLADHRMPHPVATGQPPFNMVQSGTCPDNPSISERYLAEFLRINVPDGLKVEPTPA
jgi:hypothetical protein